MQGKRSQDKKERKGLDEAIYGAELSFAAAEAYKRLRANIMFALPDEQRCRTIGITSACGGEGKSTTSVNLAYMLAEAGERVLLIEADMRLPTISKRLGLQLSPGLSNMLARQCNSNDVIQFSGLHEKLLVMSAGDIPPNPSELLGSKAMRTLIEVLSGNVDFIILDLPPVTEVSDALVASKLADGMLVVVRQNYAVRRALAETMQQLKFAEAKVLGFVMTRSDIQAKGKYKKYKYGKNYEYAKGNGS